MPDKIARKILVINCGSSSIKYEIYKMPHRESMGKGLVECIGESEGSIKQTSEKGEYLLKQHIPDHNEALKLMLNAITDSEKGLIENINEVSAVGHRVVHGGEYYASSIVIDENVIKTIDELSELAPLHNPPNLAGILAAKEVLPDVSHVAVFDTAFHQTILPIAYLYGIPREFYEKYKIRKYGFHGTSHRYVAARAIGLMKRAPENTNVISCHLGNGASVTAIESGYSADTSMGFTPLEGLMMGTRSGDIDPAILFFLEERGYSSKELNKILNKKSGLLGLSGISNDLRKLEEAAANKDKNAIEALEVYAYRVRKYIGFFAAEMVKVDILVFTGGIGQYGVKMRERICNRLENLGVILDKELNIQNGSNEGIISKDYSRVSVLVVPTNEELQISLDVYNMVFPESKNYQRRATDVFL
ncbi:acetate kinase [Candidatus Dependentiae bacterium]|nr:acetate kinase [Candidatus Dependentiae bacterium]